MLFAIIIALGLFVVGFLTRFHSVRLKPNSFYGYRTSSSMKNKKSWVEGNRYSGALFMFLGVAVFIVSEATAYLVKFSTDQIVTTALALSVVGFIAIIIMTEARLRHVFGK